MKRILPFISLMLIIMLIGGCSIIPTISKVEKTVTPPPHTDIFKYDGIAYDPSSVLVRVTKNINLEKMLEKEGSVILQEWSEIGWSLVSVPAGETADSFMRKLRTTKGIILAEPNMQYELHEIEEIDPSVPRAIRYAEQWGFININAEATWKITTGSENVIVAIVDTGVDMLHPEFADKVFIGAHDTTGENLHVDLNGHGTHVAGIAADNGRNGQTAGVAWDSPIMPIRVMNSMGSIWTTYLIDAMIYLGDYAVAHPEYRIVANMSIGGRSYNFAFKDAIDYAAERGVLLVTSAGNNSKRVISYPGAYNGVVSVAASTPFDVKASFSTTGFWNSIAAPGIKILATYPTNRGSYAYLQGTSMASPFVAGAAALLLSQYPDLTPLQIKNQLEQTARGNGYTEELGYGILDMEAMLGELKPMMYGSLDVLTNLFMDSDLGYLGTGIITVFNEDDDLVTYGTTGEFGNFTVHALNPGDYKVNLSWFNPYTENYVFETTSVSITADDEDYVVFLIDLPSKNIELIESINVHERSGVFEHIFEITEAGLYEFYTSLYIEECDTEMFLFDSTGELLEYNDDGPFGGWYSYISKILTEGTYSIVVRTWIPSGTPEKDRPDLYCTLEIYQAFIEY